MLGGTQPQAPAAPAGAPPRGGPDAGAANVQDLSQATPEAIQAAMTSNPGGNIVYWHLE
jgi:hypothetical protein